MIVAAIQLIIGFLILPNIILDGILFAVFGLILWKWNSRISAIILLLLSCATVVITFMNKIGNTSSGGTNVFLAIILLVVAIRAIEATFKLHGRFAKESS